MARTGRPPIKPEDRKSGVFPIRLNTDERRAVEDAAQRDGKPASTWARDALLRAAKSRSR